MTQSTSEQTPLRRRSDFTAPIIMTIIISSITLFSSILGSFFWLTERIAQDTANQENRLTKIETSLGILKEQLASRKACD